MTYEGVGRVVEHREFVDEIAVGVVVFDSSRIALVGQDFLVEPHLGVSGYVTKRRLLSGLAHGIREVAKGRTFLSPSLHV